MTRTEEWVTLKVFGFNSSKRCQILFLCWLSRILFFFLFLFTIVTTLVFFLFFHFSFLPFLIASCYSLLWRDTIRLKGIQKKKKRWCWCILAPNNNHYWCIVCFSISCLSLDVTILMMLCLFARVAHYTYTQIDIQIFC